jgi:hypothetical protein
MAAAKKEATRQQPSFVDLCDNSLRCWPLAAKKERAISVLTISGQEG